VQYANCIHKKVTYSNKTILLYWININTSLCKAIITPLWINLYFSTWMEFGFFITFFLTNLNWFLITYSFKYVIINYYCFIIALTKWLSICSPISIREIRTSCTECAQLYNNSMRLILKEAFLRIWSFHIKFKIWLFNRSF